MKLEYMRIFVLTIITLVVAGIYFGVLGSMGLTEKVYSDPTLIVLVGGGISVVLIGITLLFYKFVDKKPLATLGFSLKKMDGLFAVSMSVVVLLCYWLFMKGLEKAGFFKIEYATDYFSSHHYLLILPFLFSLLLGALHEEIGNRAYFYANLSHLKVLKLLLVSSLIFAVMHVFKGLNPFYFITLFTGGITFMYLYIKTGNVWVGTIIHATMNFSNSFFLNDNPNVQFTLILLKDLDEAKAYPLYVAYSVGLSALLIVLTKILYKKIQVSHEANSGM